MASGAGATGIAAGLGVLGQRLDVNVPLLDLSGPILMAPVIAIPFVAAAVFRGAAGALATIAGAAAAPVLVALRIDGGCEGTVWVAMGLLIIGFVFVPAIAGLSAWVGNWAGWSGRLQEHRRRWAWALVGAAAVGAVGWFAFVSGTPSCP
ncbi:MAG TPA: hypothetical protein VFV72_07840 [Candidatus Limnocylindrales bacterium]|nr:hypothetical protein [Candidatus Limnocylindrales bacterium]